MRAALCMLTVLAAVAGCGSAASQASGVPPVATPAATVKCGLLTCSHGHVGQPCTIAGYPGVIVQVSSGGTLGCDPRDKAGAIGAAPSPTPPPPASPVSASCLMGWVNIPAGSGTPVSEKTFQLTRPKPDREFGYSLGDYEAMQVTVSASQTVSVGTLTIVWYRASGAEISSGTADIGQVITAGQSLSFVYDESFGSSPNPPPHAATCSVISYS